MLIRLLFVLSRLRANLGFALPAPMGTTMAISSGAIESDAMTYGPARPHAIRYVTRLIVGLLLLGLMACEGVDLQLSLPSVKSLSGISGVTATKPEWQSPLLRQHHLVGRIWRPADGRFVDRDVLVEDLVRSAFILLGEKHDNPDHHVLQARLIESLTDEGRRPAVVWEMIIEDKQGVLDRFRQVYSRDSAALGRALDWDVSGWPDWSMYQPIADAAMADHLPMYGAGLPKSIVHALAKSRPSFEFAKRRRILGLHVRMPVDLRARSIEQLFQGHCELMPRTALGPLFNVQRARDAVFAKHMLTNGARNGAILIAGNGHVRHDLGVPLFLHRYQPDVRVTTVAFVEVLDEVLDPAEYSEQFSNLVLPFDYVWFTPRADDKDHCAELRQKWGKSEKVAKTEKPITNAVPSTKVRPAKAPSAKNAVPQKPMDKSATDTADMPIKHKATKPAEANIEAMEIDVPDLEIDMATEPVTEDVVKPAKTTETPAYPLPPSLPLPRHKPPRRM